MVPAHLHVDRPNWRAEQALRAVQGEPPKTRTYMPHPNIPLTIAKKSLSNILYITPEIPAETKDVYLITDGVFSRTVPRTARNGVLP